MISLFKGSIPEVIDSQSIHYPLFTKSIPEYQKSLPSYIPLLLGVIRRNGESAFIYGANCHKTAAIHPFYCIDFYIPSSEHRFTHITTIGKEEQADKELLLACFDPAQKAARVRFVLDCLKKDKPNPAKFWMDKLLDERVTAENEQDFRDLLNHIKATSSDIAYIEQLVHHIFRIRPNPCQEKAANYVWLAEHSSADKAKEYYRQALAANPNCQEAKIAQDSDFASYSIDEKISYILKHQKQKLPPRLLQSVLDAPEGEKKKALLNELFTTHSQMEFVESLVHNLYPQETTYKRDKARYFAKLGDFYRTDRKDIPKAERYYLRAETIDPKNSASKLGLALMHFSGELSGGPALEKSRTLFEQAKSLGAKKPIISTSLAAIYLQNAANEPADLRRAERLIKPLRKNKEHANWAEGHLKEILQIRRSKEPAFSAICELAEFGDLLCELDE